MKKHAPATLRNRDAIAAVLELELPKAGTVLEIASGSGEHAVFFAERFAAHDWLPSDPDTEALASIRSYRDDFPGDNLRMPVMLDARAPGAWPVEQADAILCINMAHISEWEASVGLFEGAAQISGKGAPLILYGPYFERDVEAAPSNISFDESLRSRDERWGIRQIEDVDALANANGFERAARYEMPANNLTLIYRRV